MARTLNGKVALTPFRETSATLDESPLATAANSATARKAFATITHKTRLSLLYVVHEAHEGPLHFFRGDKVWLRGEHCKANWATQVWEHEGERFFLCPVTEILLHEPGFARDGIGIIPPEAFLPAPVTPKA